MTIFSKEKAAALLELLELEHATQYTGLDDDMAEDCDDWISSLTDDEVSAIVLKVFRDGI